MDNLDLALIELPVAIIETERKLVALPAGDLMGVIIKPETPLAQKIVCDIKLVTRAKYNLQDAPVLFERVDHLVRLGILRIRLSVMILVFTLYSYPLGGAMQRQSDLT